MPGEGELGIPSGPPGLPDPLPPLTPLTLMWGRIAPRQIMIGRITGWYMVTELLCVVGIRRNLLHAIMMKGPPVPHLPLEGTIKVIFSS